MLEQRQDYEIAREDLSALMVREQVDITAEFVPWSQSRNREEKDDRGNPRRSLNWRVTLKIRGRDVLATDYGAGIAHCPS
jgi:hypothetical protein